MERGNTKQDILEAALDLFSTQGFEATSIAQIADSVGIRKASLYSHFDSKQSILDALVTEILEQYSAHSIFANADWEDPEFIERHQRITPRDTMNTIKKQVEFILHNPHIRKGRKMLLVEQFQNPELAKLHSKLNYDDVMQYFVGLIKFFISRGVLADMDPEVQAAQLCLPITVWINLCDREAGREEEITELVERHIKQFFEIYKK